MLGWAISYWKGTPSSLQQCTGQLPSNLYSAVSTWSFTTSSTQLYYCQSIALAQQLPLLPQIMSLILKSFSFYDFGIYILGKETKRFCWVWIFKLGQIFLLLISRLCPLSLWELHLNSEAGWREKVKPFVFCTLHHTADYLLGILSMETHLNECQRLINIKLGWFACLSLGTVLCYWVKSPLSCSACQSYFFGKSTGLWYRSAEKVH